MIYRAFQDMKLSALGFGGMRLPVCEDKSVDVAAVCASFGGGGHRRAAGCTITAPDAETAFAIAEKAFGDALCGTEADA